MGSTGSEIPDMNDGDIVNEVASPKNEPATENTTTTTSGPPLCGVCNLNPPKYKCPRCRLPYCSVICNKTHRENHPPDPEPTSNPPEPSAPSPPPNSLPGRVDPTAPFRVLEHSDKLQYLFRKYPCLPDQLQKIYAATQPPQETGSSKSAIPASLLKGLPQKKDAWNHDIGIQNGKQALRRARRGHGEEGEALREYSELIVYLLGNKDNQDEVDETLRRQVAEQDTDLIRRLLKEGER